MFTRYLIAACLQTTHEVIRLAENGITLETVDQVPDRTGNGAFWTLYGVLESGLSEAVGDYSSLEAAMGTYQHITGCKPPKVQANALHVELYAPNPSNLVAVGGRLAEQIEQMRGMFDDDDGTIEEALDEFYDTEREFHKANEVLVPTAAPVGLSRLVASTYEAQAALDAAADSETMVALVTTEELYPTFVTNVMLEWTGHDVPPMKALEARFSSEYRAEMPADDPRLLVPAEFGTSCLGWLNGRLGVFTEVERSYSPRKQFESDYSEGVEQPVFMKMTTCLRQRLVALRDLYPKSTLFVAQGNAVNVDARASVCAFTPLEGDVDTLSFRSPYEEPRKLEELESALLMLSAEVQPDTVEATAA